MGIGDGGIYAMRTRWRAAPPSELREKNPNRNFVLTKSSVPEKNILSHLWNSLFGLLKNNMLIKYIG